MVKRQNSLTTPLFVAALLLLVCGCGEKPRKYVGSASCKECHKKFYQLWAPSHHGKALQPWSAELAALLPPQPEPIEADGSLFQATITPEKGWVTENGTNQFPIAYAIGGKNYYNFLTLLDDGRLQVLPIFYDVRNKQWANTSRSMLRHFDNGQQDTALHWRDSMLTFNAACFSCHVSQINSNYDPDKDTYATTWNEPGISCESCHGPASEHIRVCRAAPTNQPPKDIKLISWKKMNVQQQNDSCSGCHAKAAPITMGYETGEKFWDHYDLTTFEDMDYYADGRDLGENYTLGSWLLSPCVQKGNLDCIHCHTSSGRYRFKGAEANNACLPCHQQRVENAAEHMHHSNGKGATECVQCHMPMNPFGGMNQSDHSMRPPMPNLSKAVGSRNACLLCHKDKDNDWALEKIRIWHPDSDAFTAKELERAKIVDALRKGDGQYMPTALIFIADPASDPLFVTTIIRMLPPGNDPHQHAILRDLLGKAAHPLVRSAAATALDADNNPADRTALFAALSDDIRLVRIRAANKLVALPESDVPKENRAAFDAAVKEMWISMNIRMDHWSSPYNAGNILMRQKHYQEAADKFDHAHKLRNDIAPPLINGAMAYASLTNMAAAESRLKTATALPEPSPEAHFNLGLLYGEQGRMAEAQTELYKTLELATNNAAAACNLAIMLAEKNYPETFRLLNLAIKSDPYNPRYVQTLAYYYIQTRQNDLAKKVIEQAVQRGVNSADIQSMYRQLR